MKVVRDTIGRVVGLDSSDSADDALDLLGESFDDWFRGGCADAVAEGIGVLLEAGASLQLLVAALSFTHSHRDDWTGELRQRRLDVEARILQLDPARFDALVRGLCNEDPQPESDLFAWLNR